MMLRTIMISLMNNVMTYYLPLISVCRISTQSAPVRPQISAHMTPNRQIIVGYFCHPMWTGNGLNDQSVPVVVVVYSGNTGILHQLFYGYIRPTSFMGNICHPTLISSTVHWTMDYGRESRKIYFNSQMFLFIDFKIIPTRTKSSDTLLTMKNSNWRFNLTVWNIILEGYDVSFRCLFP